MTINLNEPEVENFLKSDDFKAAQEFYQTNALPLTYTTEDGWSLLSLAALNECPKIVKYLVEDQNIKIDFNALGENPLWIAIEENNEDISLDLIEKLFSQENPLAFNESFNWDKGQQLWNKVLKTGSTTLAKESAQRLASYFPEFPNFTQLLKLAQSSLANAEKDSLLQNLIEKKVDLTQKSQISNDTYDLGSLAVQYNLAQTLSYLIKKEYVFSQFGEFDTLMEIACDNEAFAVVSVLLDAGLALTKDQTFQCIDYVAKTQSPHVFELLELMRGDPFFATVANQNGDNNLFLCAIKNGHQELIDWCIEKNLNLTRVDNSGNNAVILCAETNNIELLKILKDKGVALDAKDQAGNNALLLASGNNNLDFVKELLKDKSAYLVGVNSQNNNAVDAVSLAITRKDFDLLDLLLLSAPHLSFKNLNDPGPSEFVENNDFDLTSETLDADTFKLDSLQALSHLGYDFNLKNEKGENLARIYAQHNPSLTNLKLLLAVGVDVEERGVDGLDALEFCVKAGYHEKLQSILNQRDYDFSNEEKQKSFMDLVNASPYRQKVYQVLFNNRNFLNSNLSGTAIINAVEKNLDVEEYANFSTLHRKGLIEESFLHLLIKKSIQVESLEGFFALIGYIEKSTAPELEEKIKTVYSKTSKEFKKDTQDVYNHFFTQSATPKFFSRQNK